MHGIYSTQTRPECTCAVDVCFLLNTSFVSRLTKLQEIDDAKAAKERTKNTLESHIFDTRDKLYGEVGEELSTEAERDTINQALSQASDWLDDEGWDTTAEVSIVNLLL